MATVVTWRAVWRPAIRATEVEIDDHIDRNRPIIPRLIVDHARDRAVIRPAVVVVRRDDDTGGQEGNLRPVGVANYATRRRECQNNGNEQCHVLLHDKHLSDTKCGRKFLLFNQRDLTITSSPTKTIPTPARPVQLMDAAGKILGNSQHNSGASRYVNTNEALIMVIAEPGFGAICTACPNSILVTAPIVKPRRSAQTTLQPKVRKSRPCAVARPPRPVPERVIIPTTTPSIHQTIATSGLTPRWARVVIRKGKMAIMTATRTLFMIQLMILNLFSTRNIVFFNNSPKRISCCLLYYSDT